MISLVEFQHRVKFYPKIFFIGSAPGLSSLNPRPQDNETKGSSEMPINLMYGPTTGS